MRSRKPKFSAPLDPRIVENFAKSGLSEEHLRALGIELVKPNSDRRVRMPVAAARIWYFDLDGNPSDFYRLRALEDWTPADDTKPRRYAQPARSGSHLYLPPLLSRSWRDIADDTGVGMLVTEGEKKAACACAHGFATLGLGGVWNWKSDAGPIDELDWIEWEGRIVSLAFDSPDVQENQSVANALQELADELRARGADVRFVHFPSHGDKVGLDDFLVGNGSDALRKLLADATDEPIDSVSALNKELAMVMVGGKALVLRECIDVNGWPSVEFSKPHELAPRYLNRTIKVQAARGTKQVSVFELWQRSVRRREYDAVVYEPGGTSPNNFNLWRGFAVRPAAGDCSLFIDHFHSNICSGDAELSTYVLGWMAHSVQKPGELPGTALVLRGKQGTGKSLFCRIFGDLFGRHFVTVTHQKQLFGNFNSHLHYAFCVCAEEAVWAGNREAEGVLKSMITEPTRIIEYKRQDAITVRNSTRLLVTTNHDWPVPAGLEERRMVVIDVAATRMQDTAYFGRLMEQMNQDGLAALLHLLLTYDISQFNPRRIPKTKGLLDIKLQTLTGAQRFWVELLETGANNRDTGAWETEVSCEQLHAWFAESAQGSGEKRRARETELGRALLKMVPGLEYSRPREGGRQ